MKTKDELIILSNKCMEVLDIFNREDLTTKHCEMPLKYKRRAIFYYLHTKGFSANFQYNHLELKPFNLQKIIKGFEKNGSNEYMDKLIKELG